MEGLKKTLSELLDDKQLQFRPLARMWLAAFHNSAEEAKTTADTETHKLITNVQYLVDYALTLQYALAKYEDC